MSSTATSTTPTKQPSVKGAIMQADAKAIIVANQMPSHKQTVLFMKAEHAEVVCLEDAVFSCTCSLEQ